ncbi:MAG: SurA N-terminal domain-containing protein, partial [Candidatus Sericytochromatia bacterium]|nr:SurA N-terminal domain-containing protein [Candidatus Sericytochromatia bacterium]
MSKSKVQKISLDTDITRYGLLIVGVICLGIIFFSIFMIYISTPPERIYAARVNGNPITLDEYNKSVERMKSQYGQMLKVDFNSPQGQTMLDGIKKNMLDGLVNKEIMFEAAKKMNVSVTPTEVEDEIDAIKKKSFSGDDKLFNDTLRLNRTTLGQLRESVAKDKTVEKVKKAVIDERVKIS